MEKPQAPYPKLRLCEVMAALSIATDFGMGQPEEYALSTCCLATRLGESLGYNQEDLQEIYYLALLRHIGCNAETFRMAAVIGDELAFRSEIAKIDASQARQVMGLVIKHIRRANEGLATWQLASQLAQDLVNFPRIMKEEFAGFCEVAQLLATRLGFDERLLRDLGQAYERWDGKGMPRGLKGAEIAPAVNIVNLAGDVIIASRSEGLEATLSLVKERSGKAYPPELVEHFCLKAPALLVGLQDEPVWQTIFELEPGDRIYLTETDFDKACTVIAEFVDIKSPYTLGHSRGVADLASSAASLCGLAEQEVVALRRAALLQDVGRVGISAAIWGKPGPLSHKEWEKVRLHPYYTERIFSHSVVLARLGKLASHHHERIDGSGYYRSSVGSDLPLPARILAVADAYQAMTEPRPHRPALSGEEAAHELFNEVKSGKFDRETVNHVLAAAGQRAVTIRQPGGANGLSSREVEVLQLIARGHSIKQIAGLLFISPKTVDNHIQHIYNKIGVTTRAGAILFAMEQKLLPDINW